MADPMKHIKEPVFRWAALFLAFMLLAGLNLFVAAREPKAWAPLGPYPEQTILEVTATSVTVEGTKCADEEVQIIGTQSWVAIDPPGFIHVVGSGAGVRDKGCTTNTFVNPIPDAIIDEEFLHGPRTWVQTGTERPVDGEREGVPIVWRTEQFTLDGT